MRTDVRPDLAGLGRAGLFDAALEEGGLPMFPRIIRAHPDAPMCRVRGNKWSHTRRVLRRQPTSPIALSTRLRSASGTTDPAGATGGSHAFLTPAKLEAFVAVAEEGRVSATARRLHVSNRRDHKGSPLSNASWV
jgi:hypothetical protein